MPWFSASACLPPRRRDATRAGWSGNRFKFTVHVEEYTVLSPSFWSSPYVEFEHPLVERVVKYSV